MVIKLSGGLRVKYVSHQLSACGMVSLEMLLICEFYCIRFIRRLLSFKQKINVLPQP